MMSERKKSTLPARLNKKFKERKSSFQEIAASRINILFEEAQKIFAEDPELSDRYIFLAKKIAMKYKIHFTKAQKLKVCKNCGAYLVHGINARIRLSKGNVVVLCLKCKHMRRLKYK